MPAHARRFSVKDFTMPANPMVVTGSWSLTPDSNEATVDLLAAGLSL